MQDGSGNSFGNGYHSAPSGGSNGHGFGRAAGQGAAAGWGVPHGYWHTCREGFELDITWDYVIPHENDRRRS
jgi:hypothetical protein